MKKTLDAGTIGIIENDIRHYGADQHWYKNKMHGMSGCGPTTAALITMYMAVAFPSCSALYGYSLPASKDEFISHMDSVRKFVRPGAMGLTDVKFFTSSTKEFAKAKGIELGCSILSRSSGYEQAFEEIKKAVDEALMPALLILRNPSKELDEFTWHWMAVTGYDNEKGSVLVSTYAKEYELIFKRVWVQYKPYRADVVILYPEAENGDKR
jgi:hypothetical protein